MPESNIDRSQVSYSLHILTYAYIILGVQMSLINNKS